MSRDPDVAAASGEAFSLDGEPVTWAEVIADARQTGEWQRVESVTREGVACLAADVAAGQAPSRADVRAEAARWRRRNRLTAAEDMMAWLDHWGLDEHAFLRHVRLTLARDAHLDDAAEIARDHSLEDHEGRDTLVWATAVFSGALQRAARRLAERLAARARMVEQGRAVGTEDLDEVWSRFRDDVVTSTALQDVVRVRQLEWGRVSGEVLVFDAPTAAKEARLCLLDDGATAKELAAEHGIERHHQAWFIADVPEADRPAVLSARRGDVVGPLERETRWLLMAVSDRTPASLDDPAVRARAERDAIARVVDREVDDRVVWAPHL